MNQICLVDDHAVFRHGLAYVISTEPDLEVCGSFASAREALDQIPCLQPNLVISDLSLPDKSGLELIKDLRPRFPKLPILIVSMHEELLYAERVLKAGGRGFLMKDKSDQLIPAIRTVLAGHVYVDPVVLNHFIDGRVEGPNVHYSFPLARLSDRELEVFELIGQGKATGQIASQLHISERTVDAHRTHIRTKLSLSDSNALLRYAVRWVEAGRLDEEADASQPVGQTSTN